MTEKINQQEPASDILSERKVCLNCQASIESSDRFCRGCGQATTEKKAVTLLRFIKESVFDFFWVDSRLVTTLRTFFFAPGELTLMYVEGKRVGVIAPFRFYLFTSLGMLLLMGLLIPDERESERIKKETPAGEIKTDSAGQAVRETSLKTAFPERGLDRDEDEVGEFFEGVVDGMNGVKTDSVALRRMRGPVDISLRGIEDEEGAMWAKETLIPALKRVSKNPFGFTGFLFRRFSQVLIILMPLFAFILYLLYRKHHPGYVRHLVFSLHTHTLLFFVMMTTVSLQLLSHRVGQPWMDYAGQVMLLIPPVYLWLAIGRVYGENRIRSAIKCLVLMSVYGVALGMGFLASAVLALMTY